MFKKLFGAIFGSREPEGPYLTVTLMDKIMPMDRGEVYEDPLTEWLAERDLGEVVGGGTMLDSDSEFTYVNVEIQLRAPPDAATLDAIAAELERLGAPKGSTLELDDAEAPARTFGKLEGIGVYLDGQGLPAEVYQSSDINEVASLLREALGLEGQVQRYWEGPTETALYFYGPSYQEMKTTVLAVASEIPLCAGANIEQVA